LKRDVEGRLSADQRRAAGLLGQAQQALAERRFYAPPGQNAQESLDELLRLDPGHTEARRLRDGLADSALDAARALAGEQRLADAIALANQVRTRHSDLPAAANLITELTRRQAAEALAAKRHELLDRVLGVAAQRPLDRRAFEQAMGDVAGLLKSDPRDVDAGTARQRLLDALKETADSAADAVRLTEVDQLLAKYRQAFADDAAEVVSTIAAARARLEQEARARLAATAGDLVLLALPWGEVESVTDVQRKVAIELPVDRVAPMRLSVPAGVYRIAFKHPSGARASTQATVRTKAETVASAAFTTLDAKEYLRRAGL
jgi:hypothetical protein